MMTECFLSHLPRKEQIGLRSKLNAMKAAGYSIEQNLYNEILEWGKLRNVLSHCPPEKLRPGLLEEEDINEFLNIVKRVLSVWRIEEEKIKKIC